VATTSTLTHYNFIANNGALPIKTKPFAFVCMVPTGAPGLKLVDRLEPVLDPPGFGEFLLQARLVEALLEVSLPVEERKRYHRDPEICGGHDRVAGQNAQASAEGRNAVVNPDFHRKIRYQLAS
jgi:hypothetical protein